MPHAIRLHGPWQYRPLKRTVLLPDGTSQTEPSQLPPPGRLNIPCDWGATLGEDFRGRVLYERGFNRPTGLEDVVRVELVIEQIDAFGRTVLNATLLGEITADDQLVRYNITQLLQSHNTLQIEVELPRLAPDSAVLTRPDRENLPGGIVGGVVLEIFVE